MAIEFTCKQCGRTLRVPDETAGQQARCPACNALSVIPDPASPSPPGGMPPADQPPPLSGGASPSGSIPPPSQPADEVNPYAVSGMPGLAPAGRTAMLDRVSAPATALLVFAIVSLVLCALAMLVYTVLIIDGLGKNNQDQVIQGISSIVGLIIPVGVAIFTWIAALKMKRLQSYSLVMTATILTIVPCCNACCIAGLPLGIWALIVLLDENVKRAFES